VRLEGSCQGMNKNRRISDNIAHAMHFVRRTRDVVNLADSVTGFRGVTSWNLISDIDDPR